MIRIALAAGALVLVAGCAAYSGHTLVPGQSTSAEVLATMGPPAEKLERGGETVWYYPRGPSGWHSYAVRISPEGVLRAIEQRLTAENVRQVLPDTSTVRDVRELLGPPSVISRLPRQQREVWEYQMLEAGQKWKVWVQFSDDGVAREVLQMHHPDQYSPNGHGHPS